jgi:ATP-binding cassette, subfamily B, bacterial
MQKNQQLLQQITPFLKGKVVSIILITVFVLINTVLIIANPLIIAFIIDNFIRTGNLDGMNPYLVLLLISIFLLALVNYLSTTLVGKLSQSILLEIRIKLFDKIQDFPMQFFLVNKSGDIISRLNNDTRKLDNFLGQYIFEFISSFFTFIGIGLFIFTQNLQMSILAWAMVIILVIFSRLIGPIVANSSKIQLESNSQITSFLNENVTNYKAVSAFNQQHTLNKQFEDLSKDNYLKSLKVKLLIGIFRPIYNFAGLISQVLIVLFGFYQVTMGNISIGVLISFVLYTQRFYEPINRLAAVYSSFQQAVGAWSRIVEVLELDKQSIDLALTNDTSHQERDVDF